LKKSGQILCPHMPCVHRLHIHSEELRFLEAGLPFCSELLYLYGAGQALKSLLYKSLMILETFGMWDVIMPSKHLISSM